MVKLQYTLINTDKKGTETLLIKGDNVDVALFDNNILKGKIKYIGHDVVCIILKFGLCEGEIRIPIKWIKSIDYHK